MAGLGRLIGEGIDHIPYLNTGIARTVGFVSGIDVSGHIDGLMSLIGGLYGLKESVLNLMTKP